jgi:hypothetical protein
MNTLILLPNNQYENISNIIKEYNIIKIYLLEEEYFFKLQHEFKHIFLLETFNNYRIYLKKYNLPIEYKTTITLNKNIRYFMFNPLNYILINKYKKYNIEYINKLPNYLFSYDELKIFYEKNKNKKLIQAKNFIKHFSKDELKNEINESMKIKNKDLIVKQKKYSLSKIKHNYKYTHSYNYSYSYFPLTHKDAKKALNYFISNKLKTYHESYLLINKESIINNHSAFSALLNIGLLTPDLIIKSVTNKVFIRQLYIREYYNFIYLFYYNQIIKENYWNLNLNWNKTLKDQLYNGKTNIEIFDNELKKAIDIGGYTHHIVRLKVFLAYFLMIELHPLLIIDWFKENISIDAYDNLMYSIVFGISQSNEYPKFSNKIYLASDNYFLKISNYSCKNKEYTDLFHKFINNKKDKIKNTIYKKFIKY